MSRSRRWVFAGLVAWSAAGCGQKASEQSGDDSPVSGEGTVRASADGGPTASQPPMMRARQAASGDAGVAKLRRNPTAPDPILGPFTLPMATAGLPEVGELHATIETSAGQLECTLFADKAPITVANFVGLSRGVRPFWDAVEAEWVKRPLYDGTTFHRVVKGKLIQSGDPLGTGSGEVGYEIPDEMWPGMQHDRAGLLCMANKGPNSNGGQFLITDAPAPQLTKAYSNTVFGACKPLAVVHRIASAPASDKSSEQPKAPVKIEKVAITRR